ncbi:MAG: hypothetical protein ACRDQ7_03220 [Haloechinothrix sp.]
MAEAHLSDALARLDEHHELHLPLRRSDALGRLALRFLWLRELKWQMEVNLATRDAVSALSGLHQDLRNDLTKLQGIVSPNAGQFATQDQLRTELSAAQEKLSAELDGLRRSDQNMMTGLNQRLYALIGGIRTELSDVRLQLTEKGESAGEIDSRLQRLEEAVTELMTASKVARLRHAQLDLFLDQARQSRPDVPAEDPVSSIPGRDEFIELAVAELLDGSTEQARSQRSSYLATIDAARNRGATGTVFDMVPGRGEWFEVLHAAGIGYLSASRNPLVVNRCAELGCQLATADPLDELARAPKRSIGAVTAFRFVERLAPSSLAGFVDLAAAAIQPGGVLLVETPHIGGAAGKDFYLDPFAARPVHPHFLQFLVEAAGFGDVEIRYPKPSALDGWPAELSAGAPDKAARYCLLAWR